MGVLTCYGWCWRDRLFLADSILSVVADVAFVGGSRSGSNPACAYTYANVFAKGQISRCVDSRWSSLDFGDLYGIFGRLHLQSVCLFQFLRSNHEML